MSSQDRKAYRVQGMSCGHCEAAVRRQLERVSGVETVQVDLSAKRVVVRGDFEDSDARAAINAAGYEATA